MASLIQYSKNPSDESTSLIIKDGLDASALVEIEKGQYDLLWLYSGNFDALKSLDLGRIKAKVRVQSTESQDVSWVGALAKVKSLTVSGKIKGKIDFKNMGNLKYCDIEWGVATRSVVSSGLTLRELSLSKFSGSLDDFCDETVTSLVTLGLTGSMESLKGIDKFKNLKTLSLWNMRKLSDVSDLESCQNLSCLHVESCNEAEFDRSFSRLNKLQELFFENKEIASLSTLPKAALKKVVLGRSTVIKDGDVEAFTRFQKLEKVTFTKKRDYKYSAEEINDLLASR